MQSEHAKHVSKIYVVVWREGVFTTVATSIELVISPKSETQNDAIQYSGVELGLYLILLTLYIICV